MGEEYFTLLQSDTWQLVPRVKGMLVIGTKWLYKIKYLPSGEIDRYKARLVVKGYAQIVGIDCNYIFAFVSKMITIRCIVVMASCYG
eukprot:c56133_g1_i1 orf=103-363(+)